MVLRHLKSILDQHSQKKSHLRFDPRVIQVLDLGCHFLDLEILKIDQETLNFVLVIQEVLENDLENQYLSSLNYLMLVSTLNVQTLNLTWNFFVVLLE